MMSNTDEPVPITPDAIEILEPSRTKLRTLRVLPYVPPKTETEETQIAIPKVEKGVSHSSEAGQAETTSKTGDI